MKPINYSPFKLCLLASYAFGLTLTSSDSCDYFLAQHTGIPGLSAPLAKDECFDTDNGTHLTFSCQGMNGYLVEYSDAACKNKIGINCQLDLNLYLDDFHCGSNHNIEIFVGTSDRDTSKAQSKSLKTSRSCQQIKVFAKHTLCCPSKEDNGLWIV